MDVSRERQIQSLIDTAEVDYRLAERLQVAPRWGSHGVDQQKDFCKLYLIEEGEGFVQLRNRRIPLEKGAMVLVPQETVHQYGLKGEGVPLVQYYCHFSLDRGGRALFSGRSLAHRIMLSPMDYSRAERIFTRLLTADRSPGRSRRLVCRAHTMELLAFFLERTEISPVNGEDRLARMLLYIEDHLDEKIDLSLLADLVHLDKSYLVRLFHKSMGTSPIQYINRRRLEKAAELLTESSMNIGEIGRSCGFASPYYFSQYFKGHYDIPPRTYRNQYRQRASSSS